MNIVKLDLSDLCTRLGVNNAHYIQYIFVKTREPFSCPYPSFDLLDISSLKKASPLQKGADFCSLAAPSKPMFFFAHALASDAVPPIGGSLRT